MSTSAGTRFSVPTLFFNVNKQVSLIASWIHEANQGHLSNIGNVTLTANATSTTVADARSASLSFIGFMPTTANAASEMAAGTMFVSTRLKQSFVITHANAVSTDRTFVYCLLG